MDSWLNLCHLIPSSSVILLYICLIKRILAKIFSAEYVPAKDPTCTELGNVEYWICYECEQVWANEALTQLTNFMNVKLGYAEHNYSDGICSVCEAADPDYVKPEPPVSGETGDSFVVFAAIAVISVLGVAVVAKRREN